MTSAFRKLTADDLAKIRAFHDGESQLPPWIPEWRTRIETATSGLTRAQAEGAYSQDEIHRHARAIAQMKMRLDRLYMLWIRNEPFKTWEDLAAQKPPTREDLFRYTVEDTEDHLNGPDSAAFVAFLDTKHPGILTTFTLALLRDCDPLLEEGFAVTEEFRAIVADPQRAFGIGNREILETRLHAWARDSLPPASAPRYVHRLFDANILAALRNEIAASTQMQFARCEAACPEFARLSDERHPDAETMLIQAQWWQIDMLLRLWPKG